MKKKILSFLLIAVLICSLSIQAFAASGDVTFTKEGKMAEQNFNVDQVFAGLEPGDDATYYVNIHTTSRALLRAARTRRSLSRREVSMLSRMRITSVSMASTEPRSSTRFSTC